MHRLLIIFIVFAVCFFPLTSFGMESTTYEIDSDIIGSFGDTGTSTTYSLQDSGGEVGTGILSSSSFDMSGGFLQSGLYNISMDCDGSVSMGTIIGTGQSTLDTNSAECIIITDNPSGYQLTWAASSATMQSGVDEIGPYTPESEDTPEGWAVDSYSSEWGGHVGATSTTVDTNEWGTADTYAGGNWLNIGLSPRVIVERTNQTSETGDNEIIWFGAEIGFNKFQPSGSYSVNVTLTATTL